MSDILAHKAGFSVRLANGADEVRAAQRLRHAVFVGDSDAWLHAEGGIDSDTFDAYCDHLLVVRHGRAGDPGLQLPDGDLSGTCRLLRQDAAMQTNGFYSASEYDIAPLLARKRDLTFLELGRSCVRADCRNAPVVELLWQGIWNYVRLHRIDVMMGCASFDGTNPEAHAEALTYLAHAAKAPEDWHVRALAARHVSMARRPFESIDARHALRGMPPLIKGYLRLGCHVGDGAVVDYVFNTTDVLIILPVATINPRYFAYFGMPQDPPKP
jgi:putative hemolysin